MRYDYPTLKKQYIETAKNLFNKELSQLSPHELNAVIASVVKKEIVSTNFNNSLNLYSEKKIAVYFSTEFLLGRIVLDTLMNTGLMEMTRSILGLEKVPKPDDTADALAIAVCHAHCAGNIYSKLAKEVGSQ